MQDYGNIYMKISYEFFLYTSKHICKHKQVLFLYILWQHNTFIYKILVKHINLASIYELNRNNSHEINTMYSNF